MSIISKNVITYAKNNFEIFRAIRWIKRKAVNETSYKLRKSFIYTCEDDSFVVFLSKFFHDYVKSALHQYYIKYSWHILGGQYSWIIRNLIQFWGHLTQKIAIGEIQ